MRWKHDTLDLKMFVETLEAKFAPDAALANAAHGEAGSSRKWKAKTLLAEASPAMTWPPSSASPIRVTSFASSRDRLE